MAHLEHLGSDTKRALLDLMKRREEVSLEDAVAAVSRARSTLREHLTSLEADGLVASRAQQQGRGRPRLLYRLTEDGAALFPSRDGILLRELLDFLRRTGREDLLEAFFARYWDDRRREVEHRMGSAAADDAAGRLEVLRRALGEQGFMPEIDAKDDEVIIRECNCPFPEAIKATRLPCRLEARFFEQVLRQEARRVSYMPEGHAACAYVMPARGPDADGGRS